MKSFVASLSSPLWVFGELLLEVMPFSSEAAAAAAEHKAGFQPAFCTLLTAA